MEDKEITKISNRNIIKQRNKRHRICKYRRNNWIINWIIGNKVDRKILKKRQKIYFIETYKVKNYN